MQTQYADIKGKGIKNLYLVPRGKPQGISKTPSDVNY